MNAALLWREGEDELMEPWDIKQVMGAPTRSKGKGRGAGLGGGGAGGGGGL